ncbi:cytochrome aa3 quinol oxidase subunit II [Virgibacillus sp. 179-BFC.A HS]|uniref:Quinol oxidase subunit 2 n=1 Tax=Tigheibacillus jepli TaxID=3035914 RepID=A0ABU5CNN8_9BACI|nr:cytochrome aa3 quinol oxidase subunit II [Virgibacillus sp. 179-BFC.A HS]MDY0407063.1 cytochrome aa3 quinol oxidase subunit II [Virgibacillus sp. 179-BFC.A HS]
MKKIWVLLGLAAIMLPTLSGCQLKVLDPKGPVAETQAGVIKLSMIVMAFIVLTVVGLYLFMLYKYRASKVGADYKPPHIEGSRVLETIWITIPILIVIFLSIVTVKSTSEVEATPKGYEDQDPLIIYAASSNWKWHFSYPEQNIETVNYVNIPTNRPIEFKLYSYGPITSFWIPQLGGQKYAMSDMVNTLHLLADTPGSYLGRNSNFNGAGFAEMEFETQAMSQKDFDKWVKDVHHTAEKLTEPTFNELLKDGHLGRKTYTGTHLTFRPAPEMHHMKKMDGHQKATEGQHHHE